jgi:hypothetical protein
MGKEWERRSKNGPATSVCPVDVCKKERVIQKAKRALSKGPWRPFVCPCPRSSQIKGVDRQTNSSQERALDHEATLEGKMERM